MKVTGIIAEYNPFHNGHFYHIEQAKRITQADCIIVIMSGDFTQRGTPALLDKYARTEMALNCGADLVIELPTVYACHSAEFFAKGAVSLLDSLGVVDYICFGSECGDISLLSSAAKLLLTESPAFKVTLKDSLKKGYSYPLARDAAFQKAFPESPELTAVLKNPNNILGIEYCKALLSLKSTIIPTTILRVGSHYHDAALDNAHSSALAIRNTLESGAVLSDIQKQVPAAVAALLEKYFQVGGPVFADDISSMLYYKILSELPHGYTDYLDVSKELSDRIVNNIHAFTTFSKFCGKLKTKELTYTRISRCLIHILLDIKNENVTQFLSSGIVYYARILGFRKNSSALLSTIKKCSKIPLIAKLSSSKDFLSETGLQMLSADLFASHLYNAVYCQKYNLPQSSEYTRNIVLIDDPVCF